MGLESHIGRVVETDAPHLRDTYYFLSGKLVADTEFAQELAGVLDDSDAFAPTSLHRLNDEETQIKFNPELC